MWQVPAMHRVPVVHVTGDSLPQQGSPSWPQVPPAARQWPPMQVIPVRHIPPAQHTAPRMPQGAWVAMHAPPAHTAPVTQVLPAQQG